MTCKLQKLQPIKVNTWQDMQKINLEMSIQALQMHFCPEISEVKAKKICTISVAWPNTYIVSFRLTLIINLLKTAGYMRQRNPRSKLHSCPLRYHDFKPNVYLFFHWAVSVTSSIISWTFTDKSTNYRGLLKEFLEAEDKFHEDIVVYL